MIWQMQAARVKKASILISIKILFLFRWVGKSINCNYIVAELIDLIWMRVLFEKEKSMLKPLIRAYTRE